MLSLPGPSSGVLVSLWLSLSATRQVRVPWCRANTKHEELLPQQVNSAQLSQADLLVPTLFQS